MIERTLTYFPILTHITVNEIWKKIQDLNEEEDGESMKNTDANIDGSNCY